MTNVPSQMKDVELVLADGTKTGVLKADIMGLSHEASTSPNAPRNLLIRWDDIADISVEVGEAARERFTATRILAVGIFALAWKKKTAEQAALFVVTKTGDVHVFVLGKATRIQAITWLAPWRSRWQAS